MRELLFDINGRLRSGWRFAIFCAVFIFAAMAVGGAGLIVLDALAIPFDVGQPAYLVVNGLAMLIPALLVGWLCGKYLEGLPFRVLGAWFTKGWLKHLAGGILVGAGTVCLAVAIAAAFGGLRFEPSGISGAVLVKSLAISLVVLAIGAAAEEALFRGYILQTFARSGLAAMAIALTSVFFGVVHLGNPNADVLPVINTMLAGVWFGVAYLKTRDLWFVTGLHLVWNWVQGAFFGIEISGLTSLVSAPILREIDSGPAWLTGETYGIEGGIVTTVALIMSTVLIYFLPGVNASEEIMESTGDTSQNRER